MSDLLWKIKLFQQKRLVWPTFIAITTCCTIYSEL